MNKTSYILIIIALLISGSGLNAQNLNSSGMIVNKGKIVVKGQAAIQQKEIDGTVEYSLDENGLSQRIPQISYYNVHFKGKSRKSIDVDNEILVARNELITDTGVEIRLSQGTAIHSLGLTEHKATINPAWTYGKVILNGSNAQDIQGNGEFKQLELDNSFGADVRQGGGFRVATQLRLTNGQFRNDADNNFSIGSGAQIVRTVNGSLAYEPVFDGTMNLRYEGNGAIVAGPEIPADSSVMMNMRVMNDGGLTLSKNATHNDTLELISSIETEPDDDTRFVLTSNTGHDPIFRDSVSEIKGSYRRKQLNTDTTNLFNNVHTYAEFASEADLGPVKEMTFRVRPHRYPEEDGYVVQRIILISARDENYMAVNSGFRASVGYGWRHLPADTSIDETRDLLPEFNNLGLLFWENDRWNDVQSSIKPALVQDSMGWAYSYATEVTGLGQFAIGYASYPSVMLSALVYLEGAYRGGTMATDLRTRGLIPLTPPDIYPYNLDPEREDYTVNSIPDSVVDWMVLEFRSTLTGQALFHKTGFLKSDGRIVQTDGTSAIELNNNIAGYDGSMYVVVRHRNHLPIVSDEPIVFAAEKEARVIDFTNPANVYGRSDALKLLGRNGNGALLFSMIGGDVNNDGVVDNTDKLLTWSGRDQEGYLFNDIHMSGIVNTRDLNYVWNNRGRTSAIK